MISPNEPSQEPQPHARSIGTRRCLTAAGAGAAAALVGVYVSADWPQGAQTALKVAQLALVGVFLTDRAVLLVRSRPRRQFLLEHGMDLSLLAAALLAAGMGLALGGRFLPAAAMYLLLSRTCRLVPRRRLGVFLNVLLALTGLVAVAALALEYGFRRPPIAPGVLHAVQTVVVAVFILDRLVRLEAAPSRLGYLQENWVDFALLLVAVAALAAAQQLQGRILSAGALYVIITQAYILISLVLRGVSVNLDFAGSGVHPHWLLIGSFAAMCLVGSGLLMLPAATPEDSAKLYYDQALFTATSATCVTGLVVRDTGKDFTPFGQAVILGLIQMGGLGIMLFGTALALLVGRGLSVRSSNALGQMMGTEGIGRLARAAKFVVALTLGAELVGAILLYPMFASPQGGRVPTSGEAAWNSVFHSVSSFCNAGFALYGENMMAGVQDRWPQPLREHWQILGVMAPLIVLGGLGFPVLEDCSRYARGVLARAAGRARRGASAAAPRPRLSLHSKLVLATTGVLIVLGAAGFMLLAREPQPPPLARQDGRGSTAATRRDARENPHRWRNLPPAKQLREALFQSVTARTAGFNTVDMDKDLPDSGRLWLCGLMIIGGSPASTAGGMKTVTAALLVLTAWSMIKRRNETEVFRRSVSPILLRRTVTLAVLYLALVGVITMLLCVTMPRWDFMDLFFEACSACGTVGLSTGVTPELRLLGRLVVIAGMFAGRLGPLTLLLALTTRMRHVRYAYPTEHVVIG
jgi:trk system potassium uptake protein TrkH